MKGGCWRAREGDVVMEAGPRVRERFKDAMLLALETGGRATAEEGRWPIRSQEKQGNILP